MIGRVLGRYRLVRELGAGGMGTVYEAVHTELNRRVAVKVLHTQDSASPEKLARFFNEAKTASLIEHRNVVSVFEFDRTPEGAAYIIMEYLAGDSLRLRLQKQPSQVQQKALLYSRQMAAALAATHRKQVIHRDLKPDNIMLVDDAEAPEGERVKILDFGIAKLANSDTERATSVKTRTGQLLGTPTYMSPEQCRGTEVLDDKVDVYAMGVLLYEMLCGHPPFQSQGLGDLMAMHLYADPVPLKSLEPELNDALASLVASMLAKQPAQRPSMEQVAQTLTGINHAGIKPRASTPLGVSSDMLRLGALHTPSGKGDLASISTEQIRQRINGAISENNQLSRTAQRGRRPRLLIWGAAVLLILLLGGTAILLRGFNAKQVALEGGEKRTPNLQVSPPKVNLTAAVVAEKSVTADAGASASVAPASDSSSTDKSAAADMDALEADVQKALDEGSPKAALRLLRKAPSGLRRKSTLELLCKTQQALGMSTKAARTCRDAGIPIAEGATTQAGTTHPNSTQQAGPPEPNHPAESHDAYKVDYLR